MNYNIPKYIINDTFEEKEDKNFDDLFERIETKIHLTGKEAEENLIAKEYNGKCILKYNGERRKGVIMSGGSNGSLTIGILKEE
jgi:hypothetical protein